MNNPVKIGIGICISISIIILIIVTNEGEMFSETEEGVIDHLWETFDIKDVKDDVVYTILGTISSVGYGDELIEWNPAGYQTLGFFPITLSVDTVYKGDWIDETFIFYLAYQKFGDGEYEPITKKYNVGEKYLFHFEHLDLSHLGDDPFPDGSYTVALSQYGQYRIETVDGTSDFDIASTSSDTLLAFNPNYPNGVPLDSISGEALP